MLKEVMENVEQLGDEGGENDTEDGGVEGREWNGSDKGRPLLPFTDRVTLL